MALDPVITDQQTKAKEPLDEQLMDAIRLNLENFDTRLLTSVGADFSYRVNGNLDILSLGTTPENGEDLDAAFIGQERTLQVASLFLNEMGAGGTLEIDIKRLKYLGRPISGITNIFTANTQSIARGSATLATQSITKAEADLATQSITYHKAVLNIDNIVQVTGSSLWRLNLVDGSVIDEDYVVGRYIEVAGATAGGNNGVFDIKQVNKDNGLNLVVENLAGAAQPAAGGTVQLLLVAYTFISAVPSNFVNEGEDFTAVGHTDPSNDGVFTAYKVNDGGNNILIYKTTSLVEQVGVAGQCESFIWQYNFLTAVLGAFVIGEVAEFTGHTDPNNNGSFVIKDLNNSGGDNIVIYNTAGVAQGGVAGSVDTNRWVYALDGDPDGLVSVGDNVIMAGHDNAANDGTFSVVDVKYLATNNVVIYNAAGVVQAGANGTVDHTQKAITFRQDYSADFEAGKSSVQISNTYNGNNDGIFTVVDVNRAAISPYNIICELTSGFLQSGDDGQIFSEVRSIFTAGSLSMEVTQNKQFKTVTGLAGEITSEPLAADTILQLDILQAPVGAVDLAVNVK